MYVIGLSVVASTCWGLSDFLAGLAARRLPAFSVVAVMQGISLLVLSVTLLAVRPALPALVPALASVAAGAAGMLGLVCFYRALAVGMMSIVAPIGAAGVGLPVLVGLLQGDRLRVGQAAGLLITVAGVVLASRSVAGDATRSTRASATVHPRVLGLALLAALGFGGYFTLAHIGARGGVLWLLGLSHISAAPLLLGLLLSGRPLAPRAPRDLVRVTAIGLIDLSATVLYSLATRQGALAVVAVTGSLYPVVTVLMARLVLGERLRAVQSAGVCAALAGVALLAAA